MSTSSSAIARAIAELEAERQNLTARIGKLDDAIATLRALFHLPADPTKAPARSPSVDGNGHHGETHKAIRTALTHGPLSPGALATAVGMDRHTVRMHVAELERVGVLVSTGSTANRRIALAGPPAKEVPQR